MKVYEVARIIGWRSRELLEWLRLQGHEVGSHASKLEDDVVDELVRQLMPKRDEDEATPEEKESVVPDVLRLDGDGTTAPSSNAECEVRNSEYSNAEGVVRNAEYSDAECGIRDDEYDVRPKTYRLVGKATVRVGSIKLKRKDVIGDKEYWMLSDRVRAFFEPVP